MGMDQLICIHDGDDVTYIRIDENGNQSSIMTPELREAMKEEGITGGEIGLLIYLIKQVFNSIEMKKKRTEQKVKHARPLFFLK